MYMLKRKILALMTATTIALGLSLNVTTHADEITEVKQAKVDKGDLQDFIDFLQTDGGYAEKYYTRDSWSNFKNALDEAKDVLNNPNSTQTEIDNAEDKLEAALQKVQNDYKGKLRECLAKVSKAIDDKYRKNPPHEMDSDEAKCIKLESIATILVDPDFYVTKGEIDQRCDQLNNILETILLK